MEKFLFIFAFGFIKYLKISCSGEHDVQEKIIQHAAVARAEHLWKLFKCLLE